MSLYKFDQIAINSTTKKKPTEEDKDTYLGLENLDSERLEVVRFGAEVAPTGEKLLMKQGDVLFGKRRAYQKKVAIAPFDGIFSAHGMVLRPREEVVDKDFFPMFISSDYFLDSAIRISVGGLSPTINWKDLKNLEFNLPSLEKQRELAELLWSMEYTKRAYRQMITQTDELVKSQFIEMFGDPLDNPMGWPVKPLKEITTKLGSGATPKGGNASYKDEGISLIRSMHVYNGRFDYEDLAHIDEEQAKRLDNVTVNSEDVLLNITGASVARCCIVPNDILPARVNQHVCIIRCKQEEVLPVFINHLLIGDAYQAYLWAMAEAAGATRQALTKEQIENLQIIMPPLERQREFIRFAEQSDKSKFELQRSLEELTAMQKKIIEENLM